ncbi:hypothetical protein BVC80_339g22 [Macleaya cordata]|uniref:Uncharacterized protein n=1 Tax=Macleaya cordata TaxID=56857 RepID=A0A200QC81_MACCD|nr:hypothetical protein BVC80_339g22 [Macleaya cordata]
MTSLGPWFGIGGGGGGGNRGGYDYFGSPFSSDIWDFSRRGRGGGAGGSDDTASVIAHTNVDWRETDNAHTFRADLPGSFYFVTTLSVSSL